MKRIIVNADDFGLSPGVNLGVIQGHVKGIVTAASLMVTGKSVAQAVSYAKAQPTLSVGIHFNFGEWVCESGAWRPLYELVSSGDISLVTHEALNQLNTFRELLGCNPTHIDSHQHFHRREPFRSVLTGIAGELRVPLRDAEGIRYCGSFYGQTKKGEPLTGSTSPSALIRILEDLPDGVTELSCHPAAYSDTKSTYNVERAFELQTLCDPIVKAALTNLQVELCSFPL